MTVGGDPVAIERLAAGGPGQAFALRHAATDLDRAGDRHRRRNPGTPVRVAPAAATLRRLGDRILELDAWVRAVAHALTDADTTAPGTALLALGAGHPLARSPAAGPPAPHVVRALSDDDLTTAAGVARLPGPLRDAVHRERLRRWVRDLDRRLAAVSDDDRLGLLARWVDTWVLDPLAPIADLHRTADETRERLRSEATAARELLAAPGHRIWSFDDGDPPTVRVALGDPDTATHLVVLLPGTSTGLHAAATSLEDAVALHDQARRLARPGTRVATILDLYAAPPDLGRAADPGPARTAGSATATFLADLPHQPRTTLVGHSYGALTAARASDDHDVDDLVLLGAPGVGVAARAELTGAGRVWVARADRDPIGLVADLDELLDALPPRWRPATGPLADPLVAHGPDPTDPEFGARPLATSPPSGGLAPPAARGHVDYLRPGTVSLTNVALVALGRGPVPAPRVRRATPPRRDRRATAADG